MKIGSTLSRTESVWMARLARGARPILSFAHPAVDRLKRRGLARIVVSRPDPQTVVRRLYPKAP